MPTTEKQKTEFVDAIDTVGGPFRASKLIGTPRATLIFWTKNGWPYYRQHEVDKLIELARKLELETLDRLMRKHRPKAAK